jgi:hypothetical protein
MFQLGFVDVVWIGRISSEQRDSIARSAGMQRYTDLLILLFGSRPEELADLQ